ncbi:MAG: DUF2490 domain-containing protein [Candidatus Kapabacteria bacterium]|nr:DUF2490 domain-containing protein [Ignavibacteriota bacterium]MCW5885892.1 DUF2490 domain-containing protein [Candidatus Kapabacteria bacterium]
MHKTNSQVPIEQTEQIWIGNEFEFRLTDDIRFELANSLRMDITNSDIANSFLQFGASYRFLEYFRISGVIRIKNSEPEWLSEYFTNFNINIPIGDFSIKTRTRYQNKDNIYRLKELLRQRLMLEYQVFDKTSFAVSGELFYETNRDFIDRSRYRFDVNHKLAKRHELTLGYLFETQHNRKTPKNRDVLYIKLSIRVI